MMLLSQAAAPGVICFWDFQPRSGDDLTSRGRARYRFEEMNGPIARVPDGVFGKWCLSFERGQWLRIKREVCPELNLMGRRPLTVMAWVQRRTDNEWQYIAGVWDERGAKRQYALFTSGHRQSHWTDLTRTVALHQPHGYVSDVGGATPGHPFSFTYATGKQRIECNRWYMLAFTYDLESIRVYVDGELDANGSCNPFVWNHAIFTPAEGGADFTVAQRDHPSWPTFPDGAPSRPEGFAGYLGGLAVCDRALGGEEIRKIYLAAQQSREQAHAGAQST